MVLFSWREKRIWILLAVLGRAERERFAHWMGKEGLEQERGARERLGRRRGLEKLDGAGSRSENSGWTEPGGGTVAASTGRRAAAPAAGGVHLPL